MRFTPFKTQTKNKPFGQELVLDLYNCNTKLFSRENITKFYVEICKRINMQRYGQPMFWHDNSSTPHLRGISSVQFITTSNVTIHCLEILKAVYINIFSCKKFDSSAATNFSKQFWQAKQIKKLIILRQ